MSGVELRRWTRVEYERMIDAGVFEADERAELIGGEIVVMTPQKSLHATGVRLAQDTLSAAFGVGHDVRAQLPLALDPDSEPEPDVAVVSGSPRDYRYAHPTTALLVVEVSDTTLGLDRERKSGLYARAGIAEYWIVNLVDGILEVHRDPDSAPEAQCGWAYRTVQPLRAVDTVSPLAAPAARIRVGDLLP